MIVGQENYAVNVIFSTADRRGALKTQRMAGAG